MAASTDPLTTDSSAPAAELLESAHATGAGAQARSRDYHLRRLLAVADCTAITVGATIATGLTSVSAADIDRVAWTLVTLPAWILLFKIYGLYDRDGKRVSHATVDDAPWVFHALLVGSVLLWLFYKALPAQPPTLEQGGLFFLATFFMIFAARAAARAISRAAMPPERVLFIGGGSSAALLEKKMHSHPEYGLEPVGYLATEGDVEDAELEMPRVGIVDDVESVCRRLGVDRVMLVSQTFDEETLADSMRRLKDIEVRISLLPQVVDALGSSFEVDDVEGVAVLGINPAVLSRSSRFLKRTIDLAIALPIVVLSLPLMAAIAIAIKLDSPGPVFYTQVRVGRRNTRFRIYKFRTMAPDADARAEALRSASKHHAWLFLDHDPRITRVGRFLRRSSLDEIPQLLNVVGGNMSLVGPRPMTPDVDRQISGWGRRRLDLTPGITGLWQVLGRTNIPFEEMVKLDYLYVTNWSLWQDIRLLIRTLPVVIRGRGAN